MAATLLARPSGRYDPSPLVDLSARKNRARLTPSALKAYFNILTKWGGEGLAILVSQPKLECNSPKHIIYVSS